MSTDRHEATEPKVGREVYERLAVATPEERTEIVLRLIGEHPEGRLELPEFEGLRAMLDQVDFSRYGDRVSLRSANLRGASLRKAVLRDLDLRGANLEGVALGEADLRGAQIEEANLQRSDLAGADLRGAALGNTDLRRALLEDADLQAAMLRFADLRGAALDNADLRGADLWGANLEDATLVGADLREVILKESDLQGADLSGVNLQGSTLGKADLRRANLTDALLQGVVLSTCKIDHVRWSGAWLDRTRMRQDQLGGEIGEERSREYESAWQGYLALERNFNALGDPDGASWAYRKKRRMRKNVSLTQARQAFHARDSRAAIVSFTRYLSEQFVELLCDYGESVPRVLGSLLLLHLVFMTIYGLGGCVVRIRETPDGIVRAPTHSMVDLATFSLLALSTSGSPAVGLQPHSQGVHFLTATEAILGIALTGLLGFVIGNRIRR